VSINLSIHHYFTNFFFILFSFLLFSSLHNILTLIMNKLMRCNKFNCTINLHKDSWIIFHQQQLYNQHQQSRSKSNISMRVKLISIVWIILSLRWNSALYYTNYQTINQSSLFIYCFCHSNWVLTIIIHCFTTHSDMY
jgi:hypothetical protein